MLELLSAYEQVLLYVCTVWILAAAVSCLRRP